MSYTHSTLEHCFCPTDCAHVGRCTLVPKIYNPGHTYDLGRQMELRHHTDGHQEFVIHCDACKLNLRQAVGQTSADQMTPQS